MQAKPKTGQYQITARPRKVAPWREAERYFKRYRDTKKVIPLRPQAKDNAKTSS